MNPTISFSSPRRGLSGRFNTFRFGTGAAKKLTPGLQVDLIDARSKKVLKRAAVTEVHVGSLREMAALHSAHAHNWKEFPEDERAALLTASMLRRFKHYGPIRCSEDSICSVIYLKEIENEIL
jgi:hypothetical protein